MTNTRKLCRSGQSCDPQTFAEAVDCVAHHSAVPLAQIADRIGRDSNYLRKACSQFDDAHPFRGDLIVPLTLATRNHALVTYLARAVGGSFFVLPEVGRAPTDVLTQAATAVREFGDVLREVSAAVSDGEVTPEEAARVAREADQAIAAIATLKTLLQRKAVKPGPTPLSARMASGE